MLGGSVILQTHMPTGTGAARGQIPRVLMVQRAGGLTPMQAAANTQGKF